MIGGVRFSCPIHFWERGEVRKNLNAFEWKLLTFLSTLIVGLREVRIDERRSLAFSMTLFNFEANSPTRKRRRGFR
jgi:hypothetical protein